MENRVRRPLLLSGLIINLVAFLFLAINCLIFIVASASLLSDLEAEANGGVILLFAIYFLVFFMTIAGVVLSSVGFTNLNMPREKYLAKRGKLIGLFILDCVTILFLLIGICSTFNVLNFLVMLVLIAGATLIMVEYVLSNKEKTVDNIDATNSSPSQVHDLPQTEENAESSLEENQEQSKD